LFPDGFLVDAESSRNFTIAQAFRTKSFNDALAPVRNAPPTSPPPRSRSECRHPTFRITLLMSSHCAFGATECNGDLFLCGEPSIEQQDHRVCIGNGVINAVVVDGKSSHQNHSLFTLCSQHAASVDVDGCRRRWNQKGQLLLRGHSAVYRARIDHRQNRTGLSPHPSSNFSLENRKRTLRDKKSGQVLVRTLGNQGRLAAAKISADQVWMIPLCQEVWIPQWVVNAEAVSSVRVQLFQVQPKDFFAFEDYEAGTRTAPPGKCVVDKSYAVGPRGGTNIRVDLRPALESAGVGHVVAIATAAPVSNFHNFPIEFRRGFARRRDKIKR
jgi:hypothetical protein